MGQQKWASQYANWSFSNNQMDVWNIDQQVWIPQAGANSFWPLQWTWKNSDYGGYIGFQQGNGETQQIMFSLWNAVACRNGSCTPFGGEGVGYQCVLPLTIDPTKFYRYRLWRQEADTDGIWWGAWLIEEDGNGGLTEHSIGGIKVPPSCNVVDPKSIVNFVEYWGDEMICTSVPFSIVGYTPPAVNYHGKGTGIYEGYSSYAGSNPASGNTCGTSNQQFGTGALIKAQSFNFGFADGVLMFLGGDNSDPSTPTPAPPDMPNS